MLIDAQRVFEIDDLWTNTMGNTSLFYLFIDKERDNPFQTGVLEPTVTGSECPSKAIVYATHCYFLKYSQYSLKMTLTS